jgi:hypothetical protein
MKKCLVLDPPIEWEEIMSQGIRRWRNKSLRANASKLVWSAARVNKPSLSGQWQ